MLSVGEVKDLAFLLLCSGFLRSSIDETLDSVAIEQTNKNYLHGIFSLILKDMGGVFGKYNLPSIRKPIEHKAKRMTEVVLRHANENLVIELGYATAFLFILKYSKGERKGVKLNYDVERFYLKHEQTFYDVMSASHDFFGEQVIVDTEDFCYKLMEDL